MSTSVKHGLVVACVSVLLCSCGPKGPPRKETFPVTGIVYVDGQPAADLAIDCISLGEVDKTTPSHSQATTDKDGKFAFDTYQKSDGVPAGEYVLTFLWGKLNLMTMSYGGPDKLKGRYSDPKKSEHKFTVEKGKQTPPLEIKLTTK